jgi:ComF family protein
VAALIDLMLPPRCPGCDTEGVLLCARCRHILARRIEEPPGTPIGLEAPLPDGISQLEWCARFNGPARAALHALKYDGERRLAAPLGELMAARWRRAGGYGDCLVPVPIHGSRRRERGFDQAELLAEACARGLGRPVWRALERHERTAAQHALGRTDRARNVGGAFAVRHGWEPWLHGRWVVLVDDVTTTGATLSACAAALLGAGATAVSALTFARES